MITNLPDDEFIKIMSADINIKQPRDALYKEAFKLLEQADELLISARLKHEAKQNEQ